MEDQSEIGGAQALLQLGTKLKQDLEEEQDHSHFQYSNQNENENELQNDDENEESSSLHNHNSESSHSHHSDLTEVLTSSNNHHEQVHARQDDIPDALTADITLDEDTDTNQNLHHVQYDHALEDHDQHSQHFHDDQPNLDIPDHGHHPDPNHHQQNSHPNHTHHDGHHQHHVHQHGVGDIDDDELSDSKTNQQITDAVEAAVMRYVGGTLDSTVNPGSPTNEPASPSSSNKHNKRKLNPEDVINDYQWDRFLAEEVANASAANNENGHSGDNRGLDHDQDILFDDYNPLSNKSTPRKKRRKSNLHISDDSIIANHVDTDQNDAHEHNNNHNEKNLNGLVNHVNNNHHPNFETDMDPDLSTLNAGSEHDQLVRAAIMGAGELAKQLGASGSLSDSENLTSHHSIHSSLHNLPPHQAQQVLAAATAAVTNQANGFPNPESVAAINQLAQAASSLSGTILHDKFNDTSNTGAESHDNNIQLKPKKSRRPISQKKSTSPPSQPPRSQFSQHQRVDHETQLSQLSKQESSRSDQQSPLQSQSIVQTKSLPRPPKFPSREKFNEFTSIESLIQEISEQACNWYNATIKNGTTVPGPRPFSSEEIDAVDHFVSGYCHINRLTREDVCARVWANDRTKDSFWESLTRILPYRSRASVYKHMKRQYHIFTVRAKWTKEDDSTLSELASKKSSNWKIIGETMGRMPEDCRDRWRNYVKCGDNRALNKWSEEEEQKLKSIVLEMASSATKDINTPTSINWTLVSENMNGQRSRIQCRYKWNKIIKRESLERVSRMNIPTKIWLLSTLQRYDYPEVKAINWDQILDHFNQALKEDSPSSKELNKDVIYSTNDLVNWFDRSKTAVKEHRTLHLTSLVERLLQNLYGSSLLDSQNHPIDLHDSSRLSTLDSTATSQGELDLEDSNANLNRTTDSNPLTNGVNSDVPSSKFTGAREVNEKESSRSTRKPKSKKPKSKPDKFDAEANSIATAAVAAVSAGVDEQDTQQQEYSLWR